MEIAVLVLLTVPLTAASPLRQPHRSEPGTIVQTVGVKQAEDEQQQHFSSLNIIPFHSEELIDLRLKQRDRMAAKLRPPRAPQRGCQLGTCQLHNLANTLYQISKTNGKEESKKAKDPQGYGR